MVGGSNPHCRPRTDPLRSDAAPWQRGKAGQLAAALAAVLPMLALLFWMYAVRDEPPTLLYMLGGPLVFGSLLIIWVLFVQRWIAGDRYAALGLRTDRTWVEIAIGLGGGIVLLILHTVMSPLLRSLFPAQPPPQELLELLDGLSRSPLLLALFLGPVVWIGVALFEELWRVHLLRRLWLVWPGPSARWIVVLVAAAMVAGLHLYQPPPVMISIGILSFLKGAFYLATGRFWSLVIAHAVYDSVQIVMAVAAIRGMN